MYEETQLIIADEASQSVGRYDRIADDGDQVFAVNYRTGDEQETGQQDLGTFVNIKHMTSKTIQEIKDTVSGWIDGLLN
jgi:hypothetical protein